MQCVCIEQCVCIQTHTSTLNIGRLTFLLKLMKPDATQTQQQQRNYGWALETDHKKSE